MVCICTGIGRKWIKNNSPKGFQFSETSCVTYVGNGFNYNWFVANRVINITTIDQYME